MNNYYEMQEIILKYKELVQSIDEIISKSPLKIEYLAEKLGMSRTAFYNKRKNCNFSINELESLISELSKFQ